MQCNFYLCSVNCKTCPVVSCGARRPHTAFRGLRPRTPTYFSLVRKVGNTHPGHLSTHRRGRLSTVSPLLRTTPRNDQRGGCGPLFGFSPGQSYGLPGDPSKFHLRGRNESALAPRFSPLAKTLERRTPGGQALRGASTVEQRDRRLCGGFQRGACAPLCVVVGEGYIREGPHRKGPSLMRLFGHFFGVEKVTRGTGAEPPQKSRVWAGEAQDLWGTGAEPPISSESQKFREEGKSPPPVPGEIKDQMYPSAHSSSARSTAPPAAPRRVLWLRQTNL